MTRAMAWLVILVLGPAALAAPPLLPSPRVLPEQKATAEADKAGQEPPRPVLFPANPFPPPAPPVLDPRTGAWQQVRSAFDPLEVPLPGAVPARPGVRKCQPLAAGLKAIQHAWLHLLHGQSPGERVVEISLGEWDDVERPTDQ